MKKHSWKIWLASLLLGYCSPPAVVPVWQNKKTVIRIPGDRLIFYAPQKNWNVDLLSFIQPVPLDIEYGKDGFEVQVKYSAGITAGPARLMLSRNGKTHYYDVMLQNDTPGNIANIDYRSPKTVNPDSGMVQQRMIHTTDQWRNLLPLPGSPNQFFFEERLMLDPVAGTFRAQTGMPVSAYYVQPGSAIGFTIGVEYNKEINAYKATAGPLRDKHNNRVANGTLVTFLYSDGETQYYRESLVNEGYAQAIIPVTGKHVTLQARIHETFSNSIQLKPL